MKKLLSLVFAVLIVFTLCSCGTPNQNAQIVATTLPVYTFTKALCCDTDITVDRLISEDISCLHNYTLQTKQMRAIENAQTIVISGSGLEDFLTDVDLKHHTIIDASKGIELICSESDHAEEHDHVHEQDPHIWLSPILAIQMADNIYQQLCNTFPEYTDTFTNNHSLLYDELSALKLYAQNALENLSRRRIMTFHDGFSYMAESFGLTVVHAVEEESGSEASAAELIEMIHIAGENDLNVLFTERNGSTAAATIVAAEIGAKIYQLDMAISGENFFDAMYTNINTLKEALE